MSDDKKVIFSMQKLSKTYQGADKAVLKNIYLSFFYGAKIGILGLNGSGKSSLLKIIAGVDKNYQGDVVFQPGYTVGYLEQEPILDDSKTVLEIVKLMEGEEGEVEVSVSSAKIRFNVGKLVLTSKLIDGTFPDYERVIPRNNDKILEADTKSFSEAVDRVSTISFEKSQRRG